MRGWLRSCWAGQGPASIKPAHGSTTLADARYHSRARSGTSWCAWLHPCSSHTRGGSVSRPNAGRGTTLASAPGKIAQAVPTAERCRDGKTARKMRAQQAKEGGTVTLASQPLGLGPCRAGPLPPRPWPPACHVGLTALGPWPVRWPCRPFAVGAPPVAAPPFALLPWAILPLAVPLYAAPRPSFAAAPFAVLMHGFYVIHHSYCLLQDKGFVGTDQ